ncbi:MAG: ribonuclease HII [Acidobacteriota bacterium]
MGNAGTVDSLGKDGSAARVSLFDDLKVTSIGLVFEEQAFADGYRFVAGLDEVGRGCLAGPVVAAACILDPTKPLPEGLNDSKKLTAPAREEIAEQLKLDCIAYAVGQIEADEIDQINILEATKRAMIIAIAALTPSADFLLIDALQLKLSPLPQKAIIKGDSISASIAAASVLAKTFRDELMTAYDAEYPQYGFAGHKGYGAVTHFAAIREHGPCVLHRRSFRGVVGEDEKLPLF